MRCGYFAGGSMCSYYKNGSDNTYTSFTPNVVGFVLHHE